MTETAVVQVILENPVIIKRVSDGFGDQVQSLYSSDPYYSDHRQLEKDADAIVAQGLPGKAYKKFTPSTPLVDITPEYPSETKTLRRLALFTAPKSATLLIRSEFFPDSMMKPLRQGIHYATGSTIEGEEPNQGRMFQAETVIFIREGGPPLELKKPEPALTH
jgi:hypothetical protein